MVNIAFYGTVEEAGYVKLTMLAMLAMLALQPMAQLWKL